MTYLIILAVVALVVAVVYWDHRRNRRIRMVEWNKRQSYIRVYPNPGFTIKGRHWDKHNGRRGH